MGQDCLVLLHASLASGMQWQGVVGGLSRRFRVVAPDMLGCGNARGVVERDSYTVALESTRMLERIDAHFGGGTRFHLIGHSYGGVVALDIARRNPERVISATLYEPTFFNLLADPFDREFVRRVVRAIELLVERGLHAGAARMFHDFWNGPGVFDRLDTLVQEQLSRGAPKLLLELRGMSREPSDPNAYANVSVPVRLLGGLRSFQLTRRVLETLAAALPAATLGWLDGDHMAPVNDPARFLEALAGPPLAT
jgi:pimeloyl-ACP methyl ester carboxylesterase